jgi:hypothetical protein
VVRRCLFCDNEAGEFRRSGHIGEAALDDVAGFIFNLLEIELDDLRGDGSDLGKGYPGGFFLYDGSVVNQDAGCRTSENSGRTYQVESLVFSIS